MANRYFSIKDIEEVSTENSEEFFYARIAVLSTRPNTHKVIITKDILMRDGLSVRGKWIVADPTQGEFMTHSKDEVIVGIVPHDAKVEFIEDKNGDTIMYVDAILSKIYATQVYRMFKEHSVRDVSVEMMTEDLPTLEDGSIPIEGLNIVGITILGEFINPSDKNANIKIVQFSDENAEKYYKTFSESESDNSAEDSQKTNKELNMEEKTKAMSVSEEEMAEANSTVEFEERVEETEEKKDETEKTEEKEMSEEQKEKSVEADEKEMSEEEAKEEPKKDEKEMSDDSDKDDDDKDEAKEEEDEEDKAFACLENEDKELCDEIHNVFSCDKEFAVKSVLSMAKELKELKEFKTQIEQKEKEFAIDKVMANVKSVLSDKEFEEFKAEGLACENVDAFTNKVKAFAYDKRVDCDTNDSGIMEFSDSYKDEHKTLTADEIFNKYM